MLFSRLPCTPAMRGVYEMKKIILLFSLLFLITPSGAQLVTHQGYPVGTGYNLRVNIVAADIDGDGILEVIAAPENRMVKVFNDTGVLKWENVSGTSMNDYARTPVVRNFTGDGRLELLTYGNPYYSDPTFYMWGTEGIKMREMLVEKYLLISAPSVTQDGIILAGAAPGTSFGTILNFSGLHAFDTAGNRLWYLELGNKSSFFASMPLADIDDDGEEEAILLTHDTGVAYPTDGRVWAIDVNRTQGTVLWSRPLGGDARNVAVGDLNRDGKMEIVAVSSGGVYIFDGEGNQLHWFGINSNNMVPAIGDVDRDGMNDIVIASNLDKKIYIISNGSLQEFPSTGRIATNVALSDLNRDGNIELAAGDIYGYMYIWDRTGAVLDRQLVEGANDYFSSALITDMERDGQKELILGNYNGNIYAFTYMNLSAETSPPTTADDVDGAWHNSSVTVRLTAVDAGSGVAATYYTVDGTLPAISSPIGNVINLTRDRKYTIRYFSVDNVGNAEDVRTAANQARIDTLPPSTSDDADNLWHNTSAALNLTAADNLSGVAFLNYRVDGIENISSGNVTLMFTGEGVHNVEYSSTDNAGNIESQKNTSVKLDMSPPSTTDDADGLWHNGNVTVKLSAVDSLSGVNTTYNKVTSVPLSMVASLVSWFGGIMGFAEGYSKGENATLSNEGIYTISYFSIDNVGNNESEKISRQVKIDKTLPAIAVAVPQNRTYSQYESITLDFSAQDALSGIKAVNASIDGIKQVSRGEVIDMGVLGAGGHVFYSVAEDNAGNLNSQTVPFSVTGTVLPGTGFINGTVRGGGLPVSGASVSTAGASTTTDVNGNYSLALQAGTYNVTVSKQPEYNDTTVTGIMVTDGYAKIQDFALILKPTGTISGSVRNA